MKTAIESCRYCGSVDLFTVLCESGPHYARVGCRSCGRNLGYMPAPMTPERAAAFTLPFGKFKGRTLAEVSADPDGLRYLKWMLGLDDLHGSIRRAVEAHLEAIGDN